MDLVGGYRLVRKLGAGPRAEVYLGHAGPGERSAETRTAAIKLYRRETTRASIDAEVEALTRAPSPHLLRLEDLATGADGLPCLVLPRLASPSLARVLSDRVWIEPGEAVTILAPLADAVGELHRAGVAHGGINSSAVFFDERGAPVLARFGRASLLTEHRMDPALAPARFREEIAIARDLDSVRTLVVGVLTRVREIELLEAGRRLLAWLDLENPVPVSGHYAVELNEQIFRLAVALPVAFGRPITTSPLPLPIRPESVSSNYAPAPHRDSPSTVRTFGRLGKALLERLDPHLKQLKEGERMAWLGRRLAQVRKPFWIIGAAGLAAVALALAVMPSTAPADASRRSAAPSGIPTPGKTAAATTPHQKQSVLNGDDPVSAASALLEKRDQCVRTLSVLCLDGVDEDGSSALDSDGSLIRSLQEGGTGVGEPPLGGVDLTLTQRLGDSAIIVLNPRTGARPGDIPRSLLLVKGEAGWRIRDVLMD